MAYPWENSFNVKVTLGYKRSHSFHKLQFVREFIPRNTCGGEARCSVSYRNWKARRLFPEGAIRAQHVVPPPPASSVKTPAANPTSSPNA